MNNKAPSTEKTDSPHISTITSIATPILLFGRGKKKEQNQAIPPEPPKKQKKKKPTGTNVAKYEIAEDKVKFSNTKGLFKKHWVVIKEFPIAEISELECLDNWISFRWKEATYSFILKSKTESFVKLYEQIKTALEEQEKAKEQKEKAALRKTELLAALNSVLPVIDASFDLLLGFHKKRVDWTQIEGYIQAWTAPLSLNAQTLPPLNLDYSSANAAVKAHDTRKASKETLGILKAIHDYFNGLKSEEDIVESSPNFEHTEALLLAYYTLNDLILARVVGDKDTKKEADYLAEKLKGLSDSTNFKVEVAGLMTSIEGLAGADADEARKLFLDQIKQL